MDKFSAGDPVWIISDRRHASCKIEATITRMSLQNPLYCRIEVPSIPCAFSTDKTWRIQLCFLRPRRSSYDGDEKQTNFKLLEDLTGGWNPQTGTTSNPAKTTPLPLKEKSNVL